MRKAMMVLGSFALLMGTGCNLCLPIPGIPCKWMQCLGSVEEVIALTDRVLTLVGYGALIP